MSTEAVFDEVIRRVGSASALAAALSDARQAVSVQTVWNWRDRGFPANRCKAIESMSGVSVVHLRPSDWRDYWPELIDADGAPAVPQPATAAA